MSSINGSNLVGQGQSSGKKSMVIFLLVVLFTCVFAGVSWMLREAPTQELLPVNEDETRLSELPEGVYSVSVGRVAMMADNQAAIIIDARSSKRFRAGHIQGAVSMPARSRHSSLPEEMDKVKTTMPFVVYCESETCDDSKRLAEFLLESGVEQIFVFEGGWEAWNGYLADNGIAP